MGIMFIDFEASSLNHGFVPIEIAWVDEDGQAEAYLIKPEAGWDDWLAIARFHPRQGQLCAISSR